LDYQQLIISSSIYISKSRLWCLGWKFKR